MSLRMLWRGPVWKLIRKNFESVYLAFYLKIFLQCNRKVHFIV